MGGHRGHRGGAARGPRRGRGGAGLNDRRYLPLLEGGAAGSLGPADLESLGVELVAFNLLELALSPGLDAIAVAGGIGAFTGWRGEMVGMVLGQRAGEPAPAGSRQRAGWRGRALPLVTADAGGQLTVQSGLDGSTHHINEAALLERGAALGAAPPRVATQPDGHPRWWRYIDQRPPTSGWVVSAVPADAAREGLFWSGGEWRDIADVGASGAGGPLVHGCGCRACAIASAGYIAHLWRQREITAAHLLGWHNLCQARSLVEGG